MWFQERFKLMKRLILCIICLVIGGIFLNARCLEAITISPPLIEAEMRRGEVGALKFKVYNDTEQAKIYYLSKGDFKAQGEDGQAEFFEEGTMDENFSLSSWIDLPGKQVVLEKGQWAEVALTIEVPGTAEPGGHYGAIFFSDLPSWLPKDGSSGVSVGARMAALILAKVEGEIDEQGRIEDFYVNEKKSLYSHLPISFSVRFSNQGNVHLKPRGEIEISNMLGGKLVEITQIETVDEQGEVIEVEKLDFLPVNLAQKNVLPQSSRRFEAVWMNESNDKDGFFANLGKEIRDFRIGRYTFSVKMSYGEQAKELQGREVSVWFLPWRLILTILVIFGIAAGTWCWLRVKKRPI